jgi:hypothetical protein
MKVTHSCSYTKSISNAISSFFNNKKMNTINQSHLNNVNLVINAWEILIIKSSNSHKKDWGLCCILIICETWVFFSTLARSFSIGVLVLMTYKHSSMIVQMSFVGSNWTSMFTMSSTLIVIANIVFVVFLPW